MVYADYDYYVNTYRGTSVNEIAFDNLSVRASAYLDYYTHGKAKKYPDMEELKNACCALAEAYQTIDMANALSHKSLSHGISDDGAEVSSETVGSWSRQYRGSGEIAISAAGFASNAQQSLAQIARQYLANTGLLYRGRCFC